jgi:uncharacterized protein YcbK (DUF882 family)
MGDISENFNSSEFTCHCCGKSHPNGVPQELLTILEDVRDHYDKPVHVNSGYRCPKHNKSVGGAIGSQHLKGTAADIWVTDVSPDQVYANLNQNHEGGLGKYDTFTHIDVRGHHARW